MTNDLTESYEAPKPEDLTGFYEAAKQFAKAFSETPHNNLKGITDGKAVGTYVEHEFQKFLITSGVVLPENIGSSAKGIDLPKLNIDIKVTSIKQPQSSSPFKSYKQKIEGLGYVRISLKMNTNFALNNCLKSSPPVDELDLRYCCYLLLFVRFTAMFSSTKKCSSKCEIVFIQLRICVHRNAKYAYGIILFVYQKTDTETECFVKLLAVRYIPAHRTADYQTTKGIISIIERKGNSEDIFAFLVERMIPVDELSLMEYAEQLSENPPTLGYLTISNALQWRLQYKRVITSELEDVMNLDQIEHGDLSELVPRDPILPVEEED